MVEREAARERLDQDLAGGEVGLSRVEREAGRDLEPEKEADHVLEIEKKVDRVLETGKEALRQSGGRGRAKG